MPLRLVAPLAIAWLAAIMLALLDGRRSWVGWSAVSGLLVQVATLLWLAATVLQRGPVRLVTGGWPDGIGIVLRADTLGVLFAILSSTVLLISLLYEVLNGIEQRWLPAAVLFMDVGLTGLFLTGDAFNFYVFFEVAMTASFVLTSDRQEARQVRDALIFAVINLLGSVFFLSGVVALYYVTGTLEMQQIATRLGTEASGSMIFVAVIIFVAFSIKLGLFPFHFWLPTVYSGARPMVAAILSGALANIGSYGLLRFGAGILSKELALSTTALLVVGAASILYGALLAISRRTTGEVLAYSAVSQAGYILLSIGVGGQGGYTAAILYAVVNGLNKTLLFLSAELRGRLVGPAFAIGACSVAGLPPVIGFFGKAAMLRMGLAIESALLVVLIFLGGALSFLYMFQIYQRTFWVPEATPVSSPPANRVLVLLLACLLLALGLWPEPLLRLSVQAASILQGE